ncbi:enoyl-CoA hydratase-related protein [Haloarculaceae archaeon H-GB2-1]|nr:enoyl-CoA hydratase-related protein [Haloarculaceae archaeon H-GB1-1]MEA5386003.1 enoyl-CoA hydratase-related protein [Haloarculaceae archaeon H-GB11]MEA5407507.1 enoyl-CoA hydratase-related protein [Haloarculaceae archaeon H-GB2-1]
MPDDAVHLDLDGGVATVTLDHPDVRNALTQEVALGVADAFDDIATSDARCVVLEATGNAFCAGGDITAMLERFSSDVPQTDVVDRIVTETAGAIRAVRTCDLPTVAKIDGSAFGAGAGLAIACDILLASEDAKISFGFRQVGLAVDSGVSYLLPRLVGENVAKELVYTGDLVDAERAAELGLFNHVYPSETFEEQASELIDRIASGPTAALSTSKRLLQQSQDSSLETAIRNEAAAQATLLESEDHREGATAFLEGRDPEFEGA